MHTDLLIQRTVWLCASLFLLCSTIATAQKLPEVSDPEGSARRSDSLHREGARDRFSRESGEDVRGREEWFRFQRAYPYGRIPAGARVEAIASLQSQQRRIAAALTRSKREGTLFAQNRWSEIGPYNIAGRTRGLAIDPSAPGTIYIGAAAGGVWKTTNNGGSWRSTTDTLSSLAMGALAIHPTNRSTILAGTGENSANIDAYLGDGLFLSTDAGVTWRSIGLTNVEAFSKVAFHPTNPSILYAAATKGNGGFYRSTDGGATWSRVLAGNVFDMSINPKNGDELYISTEGSVRRSTDAGATFTSTTSGMTLTRSIRISVAVAPSRPQRVYALVARNVSESSPHVGEVYASDDSGANWTLMETLPSSFFNRQGWYDNCIAVGPANHDLVLVGGIDVYRSTNGGGSFTNTTRAYLGGTVHADQHVLEFDPSNPETVILGNDGGVYASLDGGSTWLEISRELPTTQYYAMDLDQTRPFRVYGGTQDNGSHGTFGTDRFDTTWRSILGGDGFFVVVDLSDPTYVYAENYNGTPLYRINAATRSRDRIDASISSSPESGDIGYWSTPLAVSPADRTTVYTGRSALWRSADHGTTWQKLVLPNTPADTRGKISAIGLSPFDASKMMVGTVGGQLRTSVDDGTTWQTPTGVPARFVTEIRYDPVAPSRVYVTISGFGAPHVYRSDDNGATFTSISSNLPDVPVNTIEIDPTDNRRLFVGTDIGVYVSLDGGGYWFPFNNGLALSPVVTLRIHRNDRYMVAATHGRSMFRVSIENVEPAPALLSPIGGETVVTPGELEVRWAGLSGNARVYFSYDGGATWQLVADNVPGATTSIQLPLVRSTTARVRVEEVGTGIRLESDDFTLAAPPNAQELDRGIVAEAIEVRGREVWVTTRASDTMMVYTSPFLTQPRVVVRSGIPGRVSDMAYDEESGYFYMLSTDASFGGARLFRMDTNGVASGEIPLPLDSAVGVALYGGGFALMTPGGAIEVIDTAGTVVESFGAIDPVVGERRRGLVWDAFAFLQGISDTVGTFFPSRLEQIAPGDPLRRREVTTVVPQSGQRIEFFSIAAEQSGPLDQRVIWATDTAGVIYKFIRSNFFSSGVRGEASRRAGATAVSIASVRPNPVHERAIVEVVLRQGREVHLEVVDAAGRRMQSLDARPLPEGRHEITIDLARIATGLYYVVVEGEAGERAVAPVVVVR